jgi:fatty-acyl-CoA synthase
VPDPRTGDQVMAALELAAGATFDPSAFAAFLEAQADLGTKWAPRFVRITAGIPLTATGKVDRKPLRTERWTTDEPVWWRPERGGPYRELSDDDRAALAAEFEAAGRAALLT